MGKYKDTHLHGHAGPFAELAEQPRGDRVRGVSLVSVVLDHHAVAEPRLMPRLVLVRVVWMHGVSHVGADDERRPVHKTQSRQNPIARTGNYANR